MVRKPGSKHSAASSRVTARRNDWNSIRDLHQGPRSQAASRGRIHDRSPIRLPKHQKTLAERGPSIHDEEAVSHHKCFPNPTRDRKETMSTQPLFLGIISGDSKRSHAEVAYRADRIAG